VTIYALIDPRDGSTRYIGQTSGNLRKRLLEHIGDGHKRPSRHRSRRERWLKEVINAGLEPTMKVLGTASALDALTVEFEHIAAHIKQAVPLTNKVYGPWQKKLDAVLHAHGLPTKDDAS